MRYFDTIAKIVSERIGCDVSAVKPESRFSELGIDPLDTVEHLMNLEDEIGKEVSLIINRSYRKIVRFLSVHLGILMFLSEITRLHFAIRNPKNFLRCL